MKKPDYEERLKKAQIATFPDEELKEENFNSVNTEGFEKAVVILKYWVEMTQRVMLENKNFRIDITYNTEAKKTDFCIYTPIKDGKADTKQEHSDNQCQNFHQQRKPQIESPASSEDR